MVQPASKRILTEATGPRLVAANTFTGTQKVSQGYVHIVRNAEGETAAPELHYEGFRGNWISGIDVANAPKSRDFVPFAVEGRFTVKDGATTSGSATLTSAAEGGFDASWIGATITGAGIQAATVVSAVASTTSLTMSKTATTTATAVSVEFDTGGVGDIVYLKHRGMKTPTVGIGVTPPDGSARVQIAASGNEVALSTLKLLGVAGQTGDLLRFADSSNTTVLSVNINGTVTGQNSAYGGSLVIKAESTNNKPLSMMDSALTVSYGFQFNGNSIKFRYNTGAVDAFAVDTAGSVFFYTKPSVANAGITMRHVAGATPTGGTSGDMVVGTGKVWVNDAGTWKSAAVA